MNWRNFVLSVGVLVACTIQVDAQVKTPIIHHEITKEYTEPMLLGHISVAAIQKDSYANWFKPNWDIYTVDTATVELLKPLLRKKTINVFMGTWCDDSRMHIPRLIKILMTAGFDTSKLALVALGHNDELHKKSPEGEEVGKNIVSVPTIIIYKRHKEIGRIVENPTESLEKDIFAILQKK